MRWWSGWLLALAIVGCESDEEERDIAAECEAAYENDPCGYEFCLACDGAEAICDLAVPSKCWCVLRDGVRIVLDDACHSPLGDSRPAQLSGRERSDLGR